MKDRLCNAVALQLPDPACPFILEIDASLIAVCAAFVENTPDGNKERLVSFYSQALTRTQRRYSTFERELLAVVKACEAYRVYLRGADFTLCTDHGALIGIYTSSLHETNRMIKWLMRLQPYRLELQLIKSKEIIPADASSRIFGPFASRSYQLLPCDDDAHTGTEESCSEDANDLLTDEDPPDQRYATITWELICDKQQRDARFYAVAQRVRQQMPPIHDNCAHEPAFIKTLPPDFDRLELHDDL